MSRADLRRQPVLLNPILRATPTKVRATEEQEGEFVRWAAAGITRVEHVLDAAGAVLSLNALIAAHPNLTDKNYTPAKARETLKEIEANLAPWAETLAERPPSTPRSRCLGRA